MNKQICIWIFQYKHIFIYTCNFLRTMNRGYKRFFRLRNPQQLSFSTLASNSCYPHVVERCGPPSVSVNLSVQLGQGYYYKALFSEKIYNHSWNSGTCFQHKGKDLQQKSLCVLDYLSAVASFILQLWVSCICIYSFSYAYLARYRHQQKISPTL